MKAGTHTPVASRNPSTATRAGFVLCAAAALTLTGTTTAAAEDCPLHAQHVAAAATPAASHAVVAAPTAAASTVISPYAGLEGRPLSGVSDERASALRAGTGHGMALPAELHHYPGPRHVLDLASELQLTDEQASRAAAIFERMHARAIDLGAGILALEADLDALFAGGQATDAELTRLTGEIARLEGELRAAHLSAHIATRAILATDQVAAYDAARGYAADHSAGAGHPSHTGH